MRQDTGDDKGVSNHPNGIPQVTKFTNKFKGRYVDEFDLR